MIILLFLILLSIKNEGNSDDSHLYDSDGNHIYYDRKLIRANKRASIKLQKSKEDNQ